MMQTRRINSKRWWSVSAVLLGVVSLAACSSSGGGTSSSSNGGSATGSTASSQTSAGLAQAESIVKSLSAPVTTIPQTTPLKTAPPHGKSIIFLTQKGVPSVAQIGQGIKQAASAAGWSFSEITYDPADPSTLQAALNTALEKNPTAVSVNGSEPSQFGSSTIAAYQRAGVPIILSNTGPENLSKPLLGLPEGPAAFAQGAKALAAWFVADSHGKGSAVYAHVLGFASMDLGATDIQSDVAAMCPACKIKVQTVTLAQFAEGQEPSIVVGALRQNPGAKYLLFDDGTFSAGIDDALAAAGLSSIKVAGRDLQPANADALRSGKETMWIGISLTETGYQIADIAFRYAEGMPVPTDNYAASNSQPIQLLTKASIGSISNYAGASNSFEQYKTIWKLG